MTTGPALPEPESATVEDRAPISRRSIQQARDGFERGERLHAAEKVWDALAQTLKANGQQRGWLNTGSHRTVGYIARQPADVYDSGRILFACVADDNGHRNFYDDEMNPLETEDIKTVVGRAPSELESELNEPSRAFALCDGDLQRIRTLTGKQYLREAVLAGSRHVAARLPKYTLAFS